MSTGDVIRLALGRGLPGPVSMGHIRDALHEMRFASLLPPARAEVSCHACASQLCFNSTCIAGVAKTSGKMPWTRTYTPCDADIPIG